MALKYDIINTYQCRQSLHQSLHHPLPKFTRPRGHHIGIGVHSDSVAGYSSPAQIYVEGPSDLAFFGGPARTYQVTHLGRVSCDPHSPVSVHPEAGPLAEQRVHLAIRPQF